MLELHEECCKQAALLDTVSSAVILTFECAVVIRFDVCSAFTLDRNTSVNVDKKAFMFTANFKLATIGA